MKIRTATLDIHKKQKAFYLAGGKFVDGWKNAQHFASMGKEEKLEEIEKAILWGTMQEDLLVHCHAGMSRSTSPAWGISIARGADPLVSFMALKDAQPIDRWFTSREQVPRDFIPNKLIVKHLEEILGITGLEEIRHTHSTKGWIY
jgi:hypothetical protein